MIYGRYMDDRLTIYGRYMDDMKTIYGLHAVKITKLRVRIKNLRGFLWSKFLDTDGVNHHR